MDKIYSRNRIKFHNKMPKINIFFKKSNLPENNKVAKKVITIVIILCIAFLVAKTILQAIYPIFETLCENRAMAIATRISNEQATNVMANYKYQDLCTVTKDVNGNVTMIKSNIIPINEIISDIAVRIQKELDKESSTSFDIRLGSFTGSKLLSGIGPKIHFKMSSVGNVETDLRSEFSSAGVNQTLHKIYLQVECNVQILTPFNIIEKRISNQVLLAEAVIIGTVPDTYYNLEGMTKDNAINLIE